MTVLADGQGRHLNGDIVRRWTIGPDPPLSLPLI